MDQHYYLNVLETWEQLLLAFQQSVQLFVVFSTKTHEIEYLQSIQQHLEKRAQNVETREREKQLKRSKNYEQKT